MVRKFNINGTCLPDRHYMVDLSSRLAAIKERVDTGDYFTINRARQYGKTTILTALVTYAAMFGFVRNDKENVVKVLNSYKMFNIVVKGKIQG